MAVGLLRNLHDEREVGVPAAPHLPCLGGRCTGPRGIREKVLSQAQLHFPLLAPRFAVSMLCLVPWTAPSAGGCRRCPQCQQPCPRAGWHQPHSWGFCRVLGITGVSTRGLVGVNKWLL